MKIIFDDYDVNIESKIGNIQGDDLLHNYIAKHFIETEKVISDTKLGIGLENQRIIEIEHEIEDD